MDFKKTFPDFAPIEEHIRRAQAQRSVYLAYAIAGAIDSAYRGLKRLADAMLGAPAAEHDRHAVESDAFLKRYVPRY